MGSDQTDALIIERSVHAAEHFGVIFDRHVTEVHRYLSRRAGPDSAEGLVGEVFRIAFENRSRYLTNRGCALPWLYGIAANVLRQHLRGEHRRQRLVSKLTSEASRLETNRDDSDRLRAQGDLATVLDALGLLSDAEREAVLLYAWEDLSYEEIAVAQEVPVGTVRSRLNRARKRIRERISDGGQEGDEPIRRAVRRCET
jgi:RNA polymerase sigma-70 factor (ECF subfamily)